MIKTAVFVSGGGTNLQAILDASRRGELPHAEISLVVSNKQGAYAMERAEKAGVKSVYVPSKGFEEAIVPILESEGIEIIVLAGFLKILSADFTKRYDKRIINVHPSLIPSFCGQDFYGLRVHEAALERGVKLTGATVHFANEIADGGEIIMQKAVEVLPGDTAEILQRRVMEQAEWVILPASLEKVAASLSE